MSNLNDKVVIVTGGARGMGAGHVRKLVEDGAKVVIGDILEDEGKSLASELGGNASFKHLDVTSEESWKAIVEHTRETFGPVTSLVNNAGIEQPGSPLHEITTETFDRIVSVNYKGVFLGIKAVAPEMVRTGSGSIVNIGAGGAITGYENLSVYQSSKSALMALTRTAAIEYGKYGVRVNTLHPGIVDTPMLRESMDASQDVKNTLNNSVKYQAIPRMGKLEELSGSLSFLLSEDAGFITGTDFMVDGGLVLGKATPLE